MKSPLVVESTAPTRVDLAGGTLDIWPLYLFHENSQTVNAAINCFARCRITSRKDKKIELISRDLGLRETFSSLRDLLAARRFSLPLPALLVRQFESEHGLTLETNSESPAGAGLGGSSALTIAICGALRRFTSKRLNNNQLIELSRNVESQVLRVPAGEQDYYSAVFGGVQSMHLTAQGIHPERLKVRAAEFDSRLVLIYTGQTRNSGINNWEVEKAHIDGNRTVIRHFDRIAAIAAEMRDALCRADWDCVEKLLDADWKARKRAWPGITTPQIEDLIRIARRHGARAAKACGAGGGGCVAFLVTPSNRKKLEDVLRREGATVLPVRVNASGLKVHDSAAKNFTVDC